MGMPHAEDFVDHASRQPQKGLQANTNNGSEERSDVSTGPEQEKTFMKQVAAGQVGTPAMNADGHEANATGQIGTPALDADGHEVEMHTAISASCFRPVWHSCNECRRKRKRKLPARLALLQ